MDVTTEYGQKVAKAFNAKSFPHVAIIDKTGSSVIFSKTGKIEATEWEKALTLHRNGERVVRTVSQVTYKPASSPVIYGGPSERLVLPKLPAAVVLSVSGRRPTLAAARR